MNKCKIKGGPNGYRCKIIASATVPGQLVARNKMHAIILWLAVHLWLSREFCHKNGSILTLWWWLNDEKQLFWCKFSYGNNRFYSVIDFDHVKLRYIELCNFFIKRALVNQSSTLVVAKDPNISNYLNLSIYLPTIILAIV